MKKAMIFELEVRKSGSCCGDNSVDKVLTVQGLGPVCTPPEPTLMSCRYSGCLCYEHSGDRDS